MKLIAEWRFPRPKISTYGRHTQMQSGQQLGAHLVAFCYPQVAAHMEQINLRSLGRFHAFREAQVPTRTDPTSL